MPSILIEKEVAEIFRVPQSTIRAWRIQGRLPAIRLPGRVAIDSGVKLSRRF